MTRRFDIHLRLDSPLLLGSAASQTPDSPETGLRIRSVRGLLHTWTRALLGPLAAKENEPAKCVRRAETLLLGAAAGAENGGPALRIFDVSEKPLPKPQKHENVPGSYERARQAQEQAKKEGKQSKEKGKGRRQGYPESGVCVITLRFQPRPHMLKRDPHYAAAIWAIAWTAFSLGSLGGRSRRGYGSLSIVGATDPPALDSLLDPGHTFPCFKPEPEKVEDLADCLNRGFLLAQELLAKWVEHHADTLGWGADASRRLPLGYGCQSWFQVASAEQIRIGEPYPSSYDAMADLMAACHHQKAVDEGVYACVLGYERVPPGRDLRTRGQPDRRWASHLWVRLHRLRYGKRVVPVLTWSPRFRTRPTQPGEMLRGFTMVQAVHGAVGANLETRSVTNLAP